MSTFANDIDLLHWEPNILVDASAVAQTLLAGSGDLAGTTFTLSSGSLVDARISPGMVIWLGPPIGGCFPIVAVNSASELTLSVLYDQLYPDEGQPQPLSPGSGSGISYAIRTFWPQRRIVSELLLHVAGIRPEHKSTIVNPDSLRRPCALGALQMIYTALAAASAEPASLLVRAELYQRLYRRALRATAIELDSDNDGRPDVRRLLNVLQLQRT